ncbi:hypothetical protein [Candidatus Entotheonella palauensis]|nr:hypothetical protein [Candidatus Entotheonella palauensis]
MSLSLHLPSSYLKTLYAALLFTSGQRSTRQTCSKTGMPQELI